MKKTPWQQVHSKVVFKNPYWQARKDAVIRPDGKPDYYYVLERPDYIQIIAVDKKQRIFLVRQWRYPLAAYSWEIPAGMIDHHESPLRAAKRELKEETGITAKKWVNLGAGYVSPGLTKQAYVTFLAHDLSFGSPALEGSEQDMITAPFSFTKINAMIKAGQLLDGTTIDGFYRLALYWRKKI